MVESEIGQNLLIAIMIVSLAIASITVTVGRFNLRARFVRRTDGSVELDEAGDQSIGAATDNAVARVNVVNEKANPEPANDGKGV